MKKQIKGFEDYYVDTEGRVWTNKSGEMKERKLRKDKDGYSLVTLYVKGNGKKTAKVHRLVAKTFLDNPDNYPQVNHKNGIKSDNRLENLEWCSVSKNNKHAYDTGLRIARDMKGSKHPSAKLKEENIPVIRQRLANGEHPADIAKDYSVRVSTIKNIKYEKSWSHLKY